MVLRYVFREIAVMCLTDLKFALMKMWNCGNDFENPIPTGTGKDSESEVFDKNHWKVVFDSYLEADRKQCEQWKDEVNTLLVFVRFPNSPVSGITIDRTSTGGLILCGHHRISH